MISNINVMVAGLSDKPEKGKMAMLVARAIRRSGDMNLYGYALGEHRGVVDIGASSSIDLIPIEKHAEFLADNLAFGQVDMIVDFTQPQAVNRNAELYCEAGIPFVMGTTGGDRKKLKETVEKSNISAVIATNMATPVVVFQEMIRFAAANFPRSFEGFKLAIKESHQVSKKDPSGTAVSLLDSFAALGMPYTKEQIAENMIRSPEVQEEELGIPMQYLSAHGYHTYTILSPEGTVRLQFKHNVLGRSGYVDGALKAIRFLAQYSQEKGRVFSMADVLRAG